MLLISFAVSLDILKKADCTPHTEVVINVLSDHVLGVDLLETKFSKAEDCHFIASKLIKSL